MTSTSPITNVVLLISIGILSKYFMPIFRGLSFTKGAINPGKYSSVKLQCLNSDSSE